MVRHEPASRALVALAAAALAVSGCGESSQGAAGAAGDKHGRASGTMILATTTSTRDSGLLDALVPAFESTGECRAKTVAVGSGQALELGERGDADVLLVHSPDAEETFMADGHGARRDAVMHNDFVLLGPRDDPAGARRTGTAIEAMQLVAEAEQRFASRADESGTHAKELSLWEQAGITPAGSWYLETGQGMGETLTIADQKRAYTLSDRATYVATSSLDLDIVSEGSADLRNDYHVIVVDHAGTNRGCAEVFADWITSAPTQRAIARFGVREYGEPLFHADATR